MYDSSEMVLINPAAGSAAVEWLEYYGYSRRLPQETNRLHQLRSRRFPSSPCFDEEKVQLRA